MISTLSSVVVGKILKMMYINSSIRRTIHVHKTVRIFILLLLLCSLPLGVCRKFQRKSQPRNIGNIFFSKCQFQSQCSLRIYLSKCTLGSKIIDPFCALHNLKGGVCEISNGIRTHYDLKYCQRLQAQY